MQNDDRSPARYTAISCTNKDIVLLKSIISLYGAKGIFSWQYEDSLSADLVVIGTEISPSAVALLLNGKIGAEQAVLWISDTPLPLGAWRIFRCKPPIHAHHLAEQLKNIESFLQGERSFFQEEGAAASVLPKLPPSQIDALREAFPENLQVKLVRWPAPEVLANSKSLWRLSAMLSVRSITLAELAERSAQPKDVCREFLHRLDDAGCIEKNHREVPPPSPPPSFSSAKTAGEGGLSGLFKRIRARLGLFST
jgi:hypothetical protein